MLTQHLNKYYPVLDHGFIAVKDFMGNDDAIEQMARVSYEIGNRQKTDRRGLLRYLMSHRHTSPFERCEIVFHCGMPIFVARQWIRHRTASVNEISGRYSIIPSIFYTPTRDRCTTQSKSNKQGSSNELCYHEDEYELFVHDRTQLREMATEDYSNACDEGLSREIARIDLPLSTYTYWYWKIDLHNLLHFLSLRLEEHAQWEIRQYAQVMAALLKIWVPDTWEAFVDYELTSVTFSRMERELLVNLHTVNDYTLDYIIVKGKSLGMTSREIADFMPKLDYPKIPEYELPTPKAWEDIYKEMKAKAIE